VKLDPTGFNVAYTSEALPLHNDFAQSAHPPSGQVLAMLVNDASGGESIVADGWSILERLRADDPEAIEVLASIEVGFRQYSDDADGFSRSPLVRRAPDGRFTHLRFSNQLMQPIDPGHPLIDQWYVAYRKLGRLIHDRSNSISFRLRGGDMLLVNGYRILHARDAFVADGPRHLQDVYFTTQDVSDRLAHLRGQAVNAMVRS
jgi:gamma-butyrobetaine dioxygenase